MLGKSTFNKEFVMKKRVVVVIIVMLLGLTVFSRYQQQHVINHVIYITLDGTRWQDVMQAESCFPKVWRKYASKMNVYGKPGSDSFMEVASIPVSLPSYQSQMTGTVQPCESNECGQVKVETLPEYLMTRLHLSKQDVAVFSSWPEIGHALESQPGTVYSNVGNLPVVDPVTGKPDEEMAAINHLQTLRHHVETNRMDEYTFAQSLHYFKKYKPVFMWISLVNADNEAHMNNRDVYAEVLASYDNYLDQLFATLKKMRLDKNTMVVITTDHGRGNNENWITHGHEYPESRQTWAMVMNGKLQPVGYDGKVYHYTTLSIRPSIQAALINR
jgi:hypothetical protein